MKILCIEDNKALIESLKQYLSKNWQIVVAYTGRDGLDCAKNLNCDVIILDLTLPDIAGSYLCRQIRSAGVTTPLLVLTGTVDTRVKVELFRMGADDYLTKPFNVSELNARLTALLRRGPMTNSPQNLLQVGSLTLNPMTRQVERDGKTIVLRRKEFNILEYLMRNQGRIVTRPMIMDSAWEVNTDSWNNTVDVHIKYLRDKVDRPYSHKLIHTSYGVGYTITDTI